MITSLKFKIVHINDLHSRFEEFSKIASVIEKLKDDNTLIFDAGDSYDEWRIEAIGTRGKISSDLLNEVGFSARVIGNTEGFSAYPRSVIYTIAINIHNILISII